MKKSELDSVDIEIVNLLQKRGRVQLKELSAQINLSPPATASRIRRLEEEGILEGYQAQINPISLGLYTKAFILLEVAPEQKDEFYPYIRGVGNVIECNCVTGDYSMLLEVLFSNTIELDQFIGEIQRFGHTKTLIVFSTPVEHRGIELPESMGRDGNV
jgi:Lrp/AsnC family transcriptional regulator, leucine-responsive regulatory protein